MKACKIPNSEMFSKAIHLHTAGKEFTLEEARKTAYERARTYHSDPMLLSWFERKSGSYFPRDLECCEDGKPSGVKYARSRGGDLTIDINGEDYIFIFKGKEGLT